MVDSLITLKNVFFIISTMVSDLKVQMPNLWYLHLIARIARAIKKFWISQAVSFDIFKAFDRVWHDKSFYNSVW